MADGEGRHVPGIVLQEKVDALVVEMEQQAIKLVDFAHGERAA